MYPKTRPGLRPSSNDSRAFSNAKYLHTILAQMRTKGANIILAQMETELDGVRSFTMQYSEDCIKKTASADASSQVKGPYDLNK